MELTDMPDLRNLCTQDEPVYCSNQCPLQVDVKKMVARITVGDFTGAYRVYRGRVLFPAIISRICDEPCTGACIRKEIDEPVSMRLLERAASVYTGSKEEPGYYIPPKNKLVAVIGGGLGGLSCALKLAAKGYRVRLYEARERLGGWLLEPDSPVSAEELSEELDRITGHELLELHLNSRIDSLDGLDYDAAYIATGEEGEQFGLEEGFDPVSLATARQGVFMSGSTAGIEENSNLIPVREGVGVSQSIEAYLKTGKMGGDAGRYQVVPSGLHLDITGVESAPKVEPASPDGYTAEEAVREANRCLQCTCRTCTAACDLIRYFHKKPKKIIDDVVATFKVVVSMTTRVASRQINSCNLCGLCKEVCPAGLDFKSIFLASRRALHQGGNLPLAFHDFWMRDMDFANSDQAFLMMAPSEMSNHRYMFFPGCQLGASDPGYVMEAYAYLAERLEDGVSIMTGCCGAPALWAGREEEQRAVLARIEKYWQEQGRPAVIIACPSCKEIFQEHLPAIRTLSFWEVIMERGLPENCGQGEGRMVTVFDSCASRYDPDLRKSIRHILEKLGHQLSELPYSGKRAQCCGFGGQIHAVNRPLLDQIVENRVKGSPHDYVTYCTNCRDTFADVQKPAVHLLDLIFNTGDIKRRALRKPPTLTQRRENRIRLKSRLLKQWEGIELPPSKNEDAYGKIKVYISPEIYTKMDRDLILMEDARRTIYHCESSGYKILDPATGNFIGHLRSGVITCWVVYRPEGDGYRLISIYSHRLVIKDEAT